MDISFLTRGIEKGLYPALQPILLSGDKDSGKDEAADILAISFADEANIFKISMNGEDASMASFVGEDSLPPLVQAIKVANEGIPSVAIIDLKGEGISLNLQYQCELLNFINTGSFTYGISKCVLDKEHAANLIMVILKDNNLSLSRPVEDRCLKVCDFSREETKALV